MANEGSDIKILKNLVKIYTRVGIWPKHGKCFSAKSRLTFFFTYFPLAAFTYVGMLGDLYIATQRKLRSDQLRAVSQIIDVSIYIFFTVMIEIVGNKIIVTLKKLSQHKFGKPPNIEKLWAKHERITNILFKFLTCVMVVKSIHYYLKNAFCEPRNLTADPRYICGLLAPAWFPFEFNFSLKIFFIIVQYIHWNLYLPVCSLTIILIWGCYEYLQARFKHLKSYVQNLNFSGLSENLNEEEQKLIFCIKYHEEIIGLTNDVNNSIGYVLFFHYGMMAANLAMLEFKLIVDKNIYVVLELPIWLGFEFMVCTFGQAIEIEVEKLATDLYNTSWLDIHPKLRSNFRIFLMKLNKPIRMKVGPLINLNMEYMKMVLQSSYTVLMFLFYFVDEHN